MSAVRRLVTFVDVDGESDTVSVSARHELELTDGRRVVLLDDRGWGSTQPWTSVTVEEVEETARMVVGPDEPPDGRTTDDMEADHWGRLRQVAARAGVDVDAGELGRLPHEVELSRRVWARIRTP